MIARRYAKASAEASKTKTCSPGLFGLQSFAAPSRQDTSAHDPAFGHKPPWSRPGNPIPLGQLPDSNPKLSRASFVLTLLRADRMKPRGRHRATPEHQILTG